jgi:hypothetical protein
MAKRNESLFEIEAIEQEEPLLPGEAYGGGQLGGPEKKTKILNKVIDGVTTDTTQS